MRNDILGLVSGLIRMSRQLWERSEEQELIIRIESVTDKKTAETIRDILAPEKNSYTFGAYLCELDVTLYAILMGIPINEILKVIDNRNEYNEIIYILIEKYRAKSIDLYSDKLADFAKTMKHLGAWENNNRLPREKKNGCRIRIQTRQQGCTLKYKRYELRVYNRSPLTT